jgi:haloacid dehalogenase superfamily, subfamily IA, variant 3 with third motif having DD or ED
VSTRALDDSALGGAQVLLVDLDGTLVDSSAPVSRAWTAFAKRHGLDPDEVHAFAHGRPSSETVRLLAPSADHAAEAALVEEAETTDTDGVFALPGAGDLLRSGYPLAIVTSCSSLLADVRLRAAGLPRPEVVISSSMVMRGKPDPEGFLLGARRLNVTAARCAVLEDSPIGIDAGRAAGARVIALRTTHGDDALARADVIIDNLAALFARGGKRDC